MNINEIRALNVEELSNELKDSEESLIEYYNTEEKYQALLKGEEGTNIKYAHKALLLSRYKDVWLEFNFSCLKKFLTANNIQIKDDLYEIITFIKCRFDGILDSSRTHIQLRNSFDYDIINWLAQENRTKTLKEFKNEKKIEMRFIYDRDQAVYRTALFNQFKNNDTYCVTQILERTKPQHKLYRRYEHV